MNLEQNLYLNKYFINELGFGDFNQLRSLLAKLPEGYTEQGITFFGKALINHNPGLAAEILDFEQNLIFYTEQIAKYRNEQHFTLKYFQYLALLFSELYFNFLYDDVQKFAGSLNVFCKENLDKENCFTPENLKKIAYWMATGSGKTLIMHINYLQIVNRQVWDNILLVTPNEGLSLQHFNEFQISNIPAKLYDGNPYNLTTGQGEILIIDIHKLTSNKTGRGVTVEVSAFEGTNLIFIDEGHKGQSSDEKIWKKLREQLGQNGFVFEYSATFGQVVDKNQELLEEYSKSIIFDYSYKYFYADGYGKDFLLVNMQKDKQSVQNQDLLLTAALLTYYEQLSIFEQEPVLAKKQNIERPLWTFVGSKVTGSGMNSDILQILLFLDKILRDKTRFKAYIAQVLQSKSLLADENLQKNTANKAADGIIQDIADKIFGGFGRLKLFELKNAQGEIALRTTASNRYFGVINIGDVKSLKKILVAHNFDISQDSLSESLFASVNSHDSKINILIGSKKFIEGWNTWRLSTMVLLNMGKSEGAQIIQLFGRGVRLKGENFSLKRTTDADYRLKVLQTLFIYGLNAIYINAFLSALAKENVLFKQLSFPVRLSDEDLPLPKIYYQVKRSRAVELEYDARIVGALKVDLRSRVVVTSGINQTLSKTTIKQSAKISPSLFKLINWQQVLHQLYAFKRIKQLNGLIINEHVLKEVVASNGFELFLDTDEHLSITKDGYLKVLSYRGLQKLQDVVVSVLKAYISVFYRRAQFQNLRVKLETVSLFEQVKKFTPYPEIKVSATEENAQKLKKDYDKVQKAPILDSNLSFVDIPALMVAPLLSPHAHDFVSWSSFQPLTKKDFWFLKSIEKVISPDTFCKVLYTGGRYTEFRSWNFLPDFILWTKRSGVFCISMVKLVEHAVDGLWQEDELNRFLKKTISKGEKLCFKAFTIAVYAEEQAESANLIHEIFADEVSCNH